jgi:hypothetical protein
MLNFLLGFVIGIISLLVFAYKTVQNEVQYTDDDWQREIDIDTDIDGDWRSQWR